MTAERWQQIERLYYAALECDAHQRALFLDEACGGDASLRREVESLLAANDQATGFLGVPALELEAKEIAAEKVTARLTTVVGNSLNHYTVLSRIGAGGMGEVWLAQDTRLDRQVALKMLPVEFTADSHRLQRFIREAKAASALNHPNIITIHEIGEATTADGKTYFIATEFIAGQTLRQWLAEGNRKLQEMLDVAIQAAAALDAAHNTGIVHRDIKPENIMVRPDGLVKVLDFGLAKLTAPSGHSSGGINTQAETALPSLKTQPGMILGTLRYMSPEQARGRDVDARTDIFSLGVVLYEMISGQPLFAGDNSADVIAAIIHKEPPPLTNLVPNVPPELERIVGKSLAKDSRDRYQTARDLQIDLQYLKQESELSARMARSGYSSGSGSLAVSAAEQSAVPAPPRFTLRHALLASPVAIVLLAALWWFAFQRSGQVEAPPSGSLKNAEVVSWQSTPGEVYSAGTLSPDGKWVAYTSTQSGSPNIWIKQATSSGDAQPSTRDNFDNENPVWSPTGEEIAFISFRGKLPSIWRKPPFGSALMLIKELPSSEGNLKLLHWSKNADTLYYESSQNLFALNISSGQTKQLTNLDSGKIGSDTLSISPDEQHAAYINNDNDETQHGVWTVPLRGGPAKRIANVAGARNTAWHPDGERIFYSAKVDGTYQIFLGDLAGREPAQITVSDKDCFVLDVSGDKTKVLYGSSKEESDIWGVNVEKAEEFLVASDTSSELWPDVSRDSQMLTYQAVKNLSQGNKLMHSSILTKRIGAEEEPFEVAKDAALPKWAPDGRRLAFIRLLNNAFDLWMVNASGGEPQRLTTGGIASINYSVLPYQRWHASNFAWSSDNSQLVYSSTKSGQSNLWLVAADGSGNTQFTNNNDPNLLLYCPLWSPDGKRVAFSSRQNKLTAETTMIYRVWVADLESKRSKSIFESNSFQRLVGWSAIDQKLILATLKSKIGSTQPTEVGLVSISVTTGEQRPIAVLTATYLYNIHLSADGQTIAFTSNRDGKDNIWVIPARGGQAKKLTANSDPRLYFSSMSWAPDGRTIYYGKQTRNSLLSMITNFQ